jgi:hypothetical protein
MIVREIGVNFEGRNCLAPVTLPPPYSIALLRHRIIPVPFFYATRSEASERDRISTGTRLTNTMASAATAPSSTAAREAFS